MPEPCYARAAPDNDAMEAAAEAPCVFCEIAADRAPASVVHRDDSVIAFLDIQPINAGHLLVVPRPHAASLADLDQALGQRMFAVAQRLAGALRASGLPCDGVNLFLADGESAGQEVGHVHLHVLPRVAGDGFRLQVSWISQGRAELDATAALLRARLAGQSE